MMLCHCHDDLKGTSWGLSSWQSSQSAVLPCSKYWEPPQPGMRHQAITVTGIALLACGVLLQVSPNAEQPTSCHAALLGASAACYVSLSCSSHQTSLLPYRGLSGGCHQSRARGVPLLPPGL